MLFAALVFLPVSGCAPSLPVIGSIPGEDGAHPGRGWRISFRQVFLRMGEEVVNGADSEIVVDVNGLAQGMYFVLMEDGGDVAARLRFVKK